MFCQSKYQKRKFLFVHLALIKYYCLSTICSNCKIKKISIFRFLLKQIYFQKTKVWKCGHFEIVWVEFKSAVIKFVPNMKSQFIFNCFNNCIWSFHWLSRSQSSWGFRTELGTGFLWHLVSTDGSSGQNKHQRTKGRKGYS